MSRNAGAFFCLGYLPSMLKRSVIATTHDVSQKFGVVGNTVPESNISVNKFHLRVGTNANLGHSEKGTSKSAPLKTKDNCLKCVKLISMHETAREKERKCENSQSRNHAAKYHYYRS